MISIITSINNQAQYERLLKPSLDRLQGMLAEYLLPPLDIQLISGTESISKNYNQGIWQSKYQIKAFIHQDVDMLDTDWVFKLIKTFYDYPNTGLIGLVGTSKMPERGFWWESGRQYIYGELISGEEQAHWNFNYINTPTPVECIDGFFMATNRHILFDEHHTSFMGMYDMDYCRTFTSKKLDIQIIPHRAWHIGKIREPIDPKILESYYNKWNL